VWCVWAASVRGRGIVPGRSTRSLERMDLADIGFAIFIGVALLSAVLWHKFVQTFPFAVVGATITAVVMFQLIAALVNSEPETFLIIAIITTSIYSLGIAMLVGIPFAIVRRRNRRNAL
jgi:hypothetical protein